MLTFVCYPKCSTCRKAQKWLDEHNIEYTFRDIRVDKPSREELSQWFPMSGLPIRKFFNTSGQSYRNHPRKNDFPNMSAEEIIELLSEDGMLVKRPILVAEDFLLVGFKESQWAEKLNIT